MTFLKRFIFSVLFCSFIFSFSNSIYASDFSREDWYVIQLEVESEDEISSGSGLQINSSGSPFEIVFVDYSEFHNYINAHEKFLENPNSRNLFPNKVVVTVQKLSNTRVTVHFYNQGIDALDSITGQIQLFTPSDMMIGKANVNERDIPPRTARQYSVSSAGGTYTYGWVHIVARDGRVSEEGSLRF